MVFIGGYATVSFGTVNELLALSVRNQIRTSFSDFNARINGLDVWIVRLL